MRPQRTTFRLEDGAYDGEQLKRQISYMLGFIDNPNGCYDIILKEHENVRRVRANNYYWMLIGELADETGNDKDFIHAYFKRKFLAHYVKFNGSKFLEISSTSKLTIKEFSEYLEKVIAHIQTEIDPDFKIPDPNDYY